MAQHRFTDRALIGNLALERLGLHRADDLEFQFLTGVNIKGHHIGVLGNDIDIHIIGIDYACVFHVADRLAQLAAISSAADAPSPAQLQYLQSLDQRLDLLESRLLGYFPGDSPARFQRTFPRWSPLWMSAETRTQRIGICGEFRWRITLFRNGAGLHAGVAPLPAYLEMEASISRFFSQPEIAELLRKGVPKPPVD